MVAGSRVGAAVLVALFAAGGLAGGAGGTPAGTGTPEPGAWATTKTLDSCVPASPSCQARVGHAAVLLETGKVLVLGGKGVGTQGPTPVSTAQLYDPARGTWSPTGSMKVRRGEGFTATLLADGKVLVVGGYKVNDDVPGAEMYDPAAGTWTTVAAPRTERGDHTATLLRDGRVLVAGGLDGLGTASAELYDPAADTWNGTGAMLGVRYDHVAVALADGRVLVAGGWSENYGPKRSSVEIYDPGNGKWAPAAPLPYAPAEPVATALKGGLVMVAGGLVGAPPNRGDSSAEIALYDPKADAWTAQPTGTGHIASSLVPLPDGTVLMIGFDAGGEPKADVFDPARKTWTPTRPPAEASGLSSVTLLPAGPARVCAERCGTVLVAGGSIGEQLSPVAELYGAPGADRSTATTVTSEKDATTTASDAAAKDDATPWALVGGGLAVVAVAIGLGLAACRRRHPPGPG